MLEKKIIMMLMTTGLALGCQSTSQIAKVDKDKQKIAIQSQADQSSAMQYIQRQGVLNETVESLQKRLAKYPRDVKSLLNLAQIYLSQGKLKSAEETVRKALKINLNSQTARKILAQIQYRGGNAEMASIILNSMGPEAAKDSQVLNLKALIALENDRPSEALAIFNDALKANPGDVAVRMNLGVLFVQYQQIDRAAVQFERVLKLMPEHPDAKLHLAVVNSARKNFTKAQELYEEVLGVHSKNPLAIYNLAVLEERKEGYDDAIDYLRGYLDTDYAKSKNNKEVFAMIDRIRLKKEARGEAISDSDIKELAAKAQRRPIIQANNMESLEKRDVKERNEVVDQPINTGTKPKAKAKSQPKPVKKVKKKVVAPKDDDIESLERALE